MKQAGTENNRLSTGIVGLDEVLCGGLVSGRAYLVRGGPGSGKTSLGVSFLAAGMAAGESTLFVSMGEPREQIVQNYAELGFDLAALEFLDLSPDAAFFAQSESYDIFSPAEVERAPTTKAIVERVEAVQPRRIFIDAMTQFRYLASDPFQYRKQVLSFLRFLVERGATVLFTSESGPEAPDQDLQFLADGVIETGNDAGDRHLVVHKFRGSDFLPGRHALTIGPGGLKVFPRLRPQGRARQFVPGLISSGVPALDELLGGGLERGTVTIISGPSGVGKTSLGFQFIKEAAGRGERSAVYTFEEAREPLLQRCQAISIPVEAMVQQGTLMVEPIEPQQFTPEEFAALVRREVGENSTRVVMLDSLAGFRLSVRGTDLVAEVHALCKHLANLGVTVLLVNEVEHITGEFRATELGISYLADNIVFLRYLEISGELKKAIGVLKKRLSDFEKTLREFEITRYGLKIGEPLRGLRGILSGTPTWVREPTHD